MTDATAFLAAILEAPDDDTPRLIFADWLEERGDPRGEFIRVQLALAKMTQPEELTQGVLSSDPKVIAQHTCVRCRKLEAGFCPWHQLHFREQELLALRATTAWGTPAAFPLWWQWTNGLPAYIQVGETPEKSSLAFRRGFVASITLPTQAFLDHAAALFAAAPIETVTLSDHPDEVDSWNLIRTRQESDRLLEEAGVFDDGEGKIIFRLADALIHYARHLARLPPLTRAAHG